jgi:hypothetical protein
MEGFYHPMLLPPCDPLRKLYTLNWMPMSRLFLRLATWRLALIKGISLELISNDMIALCIFAVVIMGAASLRFRKRLD